MLLRQLWLRDFRCYTELDLEIAPGCTVITGANGQGKTSLLEAVGWIASWRSLRGVPDAALVRSGAEVAIVRAALTRDDRELMIEAEIRSVGRDRVLVNKQSVTRKRDLRDHLRVTVFAPDDLELVKGGPALRRDFLDDLLESSAPRFAAVRTDLDRVLRQRNALLRAGIRDADDRTTLEVLDDRLVETGTTLVAGRIALVTRLTPLVEAAYASLAGDAPGFATQYAPGWTDDAVAEADVEDALRAALRALRRREEDRGTTLVGPHRDDWRLTLEELDARQHASQGEQRTLALALRLAGHRLVSDVIGTEPVLLLDDVFSELDRDRAQALVANLPAAQTLLTTAGAIPEGVRADAIALVEQGRVTS